MDPHDEVEVVGLHVPYGAVPDDAGVVDDDVEPAPAVHTGTDHVGHLGFVPDVAVVRHGLAAPFSDDLHHLIGVAPLALAGDRGAEVVDHDPRPLFGQLEGVGAADAVPGPGHEGYLAVEQCHRDASFSGCRP